MLDDLGLTVNLKSVEGDWMFFGAPGTPGTSGLRAAREAYKNARDTPGFTKVKAVRKGHVVPVDGSAWTSAGGPIAEREVVDDVARALTSG